MGDGGGVGDGRRVKDGGGVGVGRVGGSRDVCKKVRLERGGGYGE